MTQREKRHERIVSNPRDVDFRDIEPWLRDFGFELRRIAGSHHVFTHKKGIVLNFQPGRNGKAKAYQVKQAVEALNELKEREP